MHFSQFKIHLNLNFIFNFTKLLPNFYQTFTKLLPNFYQTQITLHLHDIYVTPKTMISKIPPTNLFFSFKLFRNPKAMKKVANFCGTSRPWYQWYLHLVREPINYYLNLCRVTFSPPLSICFLHNACKKPFKGGRLFIHTKVQKYKSTKVPF